MTPECDVDLYSGPAHVDCRTQSATTPLGTADAARQVDKGGGERAEGSGAYPTNKGARPMEVESQFDGGKPPDVGICPYTACGALSDIFFAPPSSPICQLAPFPLASPCL